MQILINNIFFIESQIKENFTSLLSNSLPRSRGNKKKKLLNRHEPSRSCHEDAQQEFHTSKTEDEAVTKLSSFVMEPFVGNYGECFKVSVFATRFTFGLQGFYLCYKPYTEGTRPILFFPKNVSFCPKPLTQQQIANSEITKKFAMLQHIQAGMALKNNIFGVSLTINNQDYAIAQWRRFFYIFHFTFYPQTWRNFQCRIPTFKLTLNSTTTPLCGRQDIRRISSPF